MVKNTRNLISVIFLSLVSILALSTCIGLLLSNAATKRQADASRSELDVLENEGYYTKAQAKQLIERAESAARKEEGDIIRSQFREKLVEGDKLGAVRALYPDEIVTEYGGQYFFTPILEDIDNSSIFPDEMVLSDDGNIYYGGENSNIVLTRGIDISRSQGIIDFVKVKESGIDFVMIRVGLRGAAEGQILEDDLFKTNIRQAQKAGLDVGVYFYSQAINDKEAVEEADFVINLLEGYEITYPVAIELEQVNSADARTAKLTMSHYTQIAKAFCNEVENAGYSPMIAGNIRTFSELLDIRKIKTFPVWVSYYGFPQYYPYDYYMWQYSKTGKVDGIDGEVNMNLCIFAK
ncbi:glycoside hydrolase family 25 protein [Butyrivibrio sp. AE3004]|uniref:glycoside hydrolase family 25 protein n=1 Tax=Butyrivibrio sp. AE3004 TaxID=1506994 RepID=UPI0018CC2BFE|nr:glycoside hydrolase family 25 protein [Butyrivibrio sp. AE3004]